MNISQLKNDLSRCVKCGQCKTVCPVYRVTHKEQFLARGKLSLCLALAQKKVAPSCELRAILDSCMKCYQCVANCPTGIHPVHLILQTRQYLRGGGIKSALTRFLMRTIIPHRQRYNLFMKLARISQKILPRKGQQLRHIPFIFENKMTVPEISQEPALETLPEITGKSKKKIGLFLGCLINYVYPEIALYVVKILTSLGYEVVIPKKQACCGIPALYLNDRIAACKLYRHNVAAFRRFNLDAVVTACASCGTALKEEYALMDKNNKQALGAKVFDISEFLSNKMFHIKTGQEREKITYHDPCHLRFSQGIWKEPRKIVTQIADISEAAESWRCCGGGGTFSVFYRNLSQEIGKLKCETLLETDAKTIITACPGCILQLRATLSGNVPVKHIVEFLWEKIA
ncbi:MAG: (Fe-S)-binding protein [Planctomycetota bacterium]